MGHEQVAAPREVACHREVLGRAHVAGGEDRVELDDELQDLERLRQQPAVGVDHGDPRAGDAERRTDAGVEVLAAAQRREPHDLPRRAAARPRRQPGSRPPDLAIAADAAEHAHAVDQPVDHVRESGGRGVVALEHERRVAGRGRVARGLDRVDRSRPVRVRTEVDVEIGRAGEVDAHGALAGGCGLDDGEVLGEQDLAVEVRGRLRDPLGLGAGRRTGDGWVSTSVRTPALAAVRPASSTDEW